MKITCCETGVSFFSYEELYAEMNIPKRTIQRYLAGKQRSAKGYHFFKN